MHHAVPTLLHYFFFFFFIFSRHSHEKEITDSHSFVRVELPVHSERKSEQTAGLSVFPDHMVGVQVEGQRKRCVQKGEKCHANAPSQQHTGACLRRKVSETQSLLCSLASRHGDTGSRRGLIALRVRGRWSIAPSLAKLWYYNKGVTPSMYTNACCIKPTKG